MLTLAFTELENSPTSNDITITDSTGLYTVNTTGGYGSPNPDRADLKLFIKSFHVTGALAEVPLDPENYNTTSATTFTYLSIPDGWKKHFLIGIDVTATVPTDEDVNGYFDAMTSDELAALVNGDTVTIGGEDYTMYITYAQTFPVPQAKIDKWEANERLNMCLYDCSEETAAARTLFESIYYTLIGAVYDFQRENRLQAQIDVERVNEIGAQLYAES